MMSHKAEQPYRIVDEGALHKYRTEIPNTIIRGIKSRGLSLPARWLYVYLKSIAGDGGECWQNTTTLAEGAQIGRGTVTSAKAELITKKLIVVMPGRLGYHDTDKIRILDIWDDNMCEFASMSRSGGEREEQRESPIKTGENAGRVQEVNAGEISRSGGEREEQRESPIKTGENAGRVQEVNAVVQEVNAVVQEVNAVVQEVNAPLIGIKKIPIKKIPKEEEYREALPTVALAPVVPMSDPVPPMKKKKTKAPLTRMPTDHEAQASLRLSMVDIPFHAWMTKKGLTYDLDDQWDAFVRRALAKGYEYVDWRAAFQNWLTSEYQRPAKVTTSHQQETVDEYKTRMTAELKAKGLWTE